MKGAILSISILLGVQSGLLTFYFLMLAFWGWVHSGRLTFVPRKRG